MRICCGYKVQFMLFIWRIILRQLSTLFSVSLLSMAVLSGCSKPAENNATSTEAKPAQSAQTATQAPAESSTATADTATASQINITIATEGAYKPFNYVDKEGKPVGFDIDVANALCAQMQANCEIVTQDWDGIIPGLIAKKYDAVIAGMSITEKRLQKVDFSAPYFKNSLIYIGKKGVEVDVTALADKKLGAQAGTVAAQNLADNLASNNEIKTYKTQDDAYADLKSGRIDFMLSDLAPAKDWMKSPAGADFEQKGAEIDNNDLLGIAVRKGDDLKGKLDTAMAAIKENGQYQTIYDSYFK